ncbi:cytochrome C [hot springs metagenome]|uniref:Cytochrome C n=1 Tax=hot springs metagenome TaxID=433727 RepID=A0A5J4KWQ9_9ZZZZ
MFFIRMFFVVAACLLLPLSAFAFGGHDGLVCSGCHSIHAAKDALIFAVEANKKDVNPRTKQSYTGITALCLGCHQTPEKGGMGIKPISAHMSHPYGLNSVNAKVARVPEDALRDGKFECIGCHDPHPSNPNYRYLRYDAGANGSKMENFCAACHPMKADPKAASAKPQGFNSMDERLFGASGSYVPAVPAETPAPKPKKK